MENNKVKKKSPVGIIILVLLICCACGVAGFFGGKYYFENNNKDTDKVVDKEEKETKEEEEETEKEETKSTDEVTYEVIDQRENADYSYKIQLSSNGEVLVESDNIKKDTVVATNILKAKAMRYSMSDICMGNLVIMMVTKDNTLSYFSVDDIVCGEATKVEVFKNVGNLTNVVDVSRKMAAEATEYEPASYAIHAITKDGKDIDITKYLDVEDEEE